MQKELYETMQKYRKNKLFKDKKQIHTKVKEVTGDAGVVSKMDFNS